MASSNVKELAEKSVDELNSDLDGLYREQFNLRMQRGSGQEIKPHNFKRVRREIARIKTIIGQKSAAEI
ncbi:MAG: 50S ribosomal protein L29 [Granulosicoccus sp.]